MSQHVVYIAPRPSALLELALAGFAPVHVSNGENGLGRSIASLRPRDLVRYGASIAVLLHQLKILKPAVVVLWERDDTRNILPILFRELPDTRFISIQSAWFLESAHLHLWWPGDRRRLKVLVWGKYAIDLATQQGRDSRGRYGVGSLEAGLFAEFFSCEQPSALVNQICLVSKRKFGVSQSVETVQSVERKKNVETVVSLVARHCRAVGLSAVIPIDSRRSDEEVAKDNEWLEQLDVADSVRLTSDLPPIVARRPDWFPQATPLPNVEMFRALATASTSRLVVGNQNSAVIWQSLALQFPVLAVGFGEHQFFRFPIEGPWSLHNPSFGDFSSRASQLAELPTSRYSITDNAATRYLINQEPSSGPVFVVRRLVQSALEGEQWDY